MSPLQIIGAILAVIVVIRFYLAFKHLDFSSARQLMEEQNEETAPD